jgi:hypothetical protein
MHYMFLNALSVPYILVAASSLETKSVFSYAQNKTPVGTWNQTPHVRALHLCKHTHSICYPLRFFTEQHRHKFHHAGWHYHRRIPGPREWRMVKTAATTTAASSQTPAAAAIYLTWPLGIQLGLSSPSNASCLRWSSKSSQYKIDVVPLMISGSQAWSKAGSVLFIIDVKGVQCLREWSRRTVTA